MFSKVDALKNFAEFTKKTPVPESFFNKAAGLHLATLLKNRL